MDSDQLLCDYIFGLLGESEVKALESELKNSPALSLRLAELNEIFGGLDSVKEDFPNPLTKLRNRICQLSYAGLTMASAFTLFWATMFGAVSVEGAEMSDAKAGKNFVSSYISCTSESTAKKSIAVLFNNLSNFRK